MTGCVRLRVEGLMLEKLTARAMNEGARFSRLTRVGRRVLLVETDAAGAAVLEALCQRFSISCRRLAVSSEQEKPPRERRAECSVTQVSSSGTACSAVMPVTLT